MTFLLLGEVTELEGHAGSYWAKIKEKNHERNPTTLPTCSFFFNGWSDTATARSCVHVRACIYTARRFRLGRFAISKETTQLRRRRR